MDCTITNTVAVLKKIADITGVPVVTSGLTAISMKVPKGYSCREVLSYLAQLHGAFAIRNRRGQIQLHTYVDSNYKVKPNRYWVNFNIMIIHLMFQNLCVLRARIKMKKHNNI